MYPDGEPICIYCTFGYLNNRDFSKSEESLSLTVVTSFQTHLVELPSKELPFNVSNSFLVRLIKNSSNESAFCTCKCS